MLLFDPRDRWTVEECLEKLKKIEGVSGTGCRSADASTNGSPDISIRS